MNATKIADVIARFEVVNHGWDGDSYFQGCCTSFTNYDHVVTGRGYTEKEAVEDALEQIPTGFEIDANNLAMVEAEVMRQYGEEGPCTKTWEEIDSEPANDEWGIRVSIRFSLLSANINAIRYDENGEMYIA